ncbi:helix-turn-helix transcriptional regulator [Eubacterium sp. 1001713B170207_170306_E7]|uniref:helix-turn-helix domain-containing protein n=1 Tax=Eubacterium sp. 1001713B170207_170306_E7 TaxID=2787097 RepID=UPI0018993DC5|nr:helix-turn-helix transcriptional regulator [Eubacterium sp. 1001713B170207_170306_E7]
MKNNNIGNIIKQARKKEGLTQAELGELMGITAVTVGQWETGKRIPKDETIERLSEALGIDLADSINAISFSRTSDILTILYDLACHEKIPVELLIKSVIFEMEFVLKELELHWRYLNRGDIDSRQLLDEDYFSEPEVNGYDFSPYWDSRTPENAEHRERLSKKITDALKEYVEATKIMSPYYRITDTYRVEVEE